MISNEDTYIDDLEVTTGGATKLGDAIYHGPNGMGATARPLRLRGKVTKAIATTGSYELAFVQADDAALSTNMEVLLRSKVVTNAHGVGHDIFGGAKLPAVTKPYTGVLKTGSAPTGNPTVWVGLVPADDHGLPQF